MGFSCKKCWFNRRCMHRIKCDVLFYFCSSFFFLLLVSNKSVHVNWIILFACRLVVGVSLSPSLSFHITIVKRMMMMTSSVQHRFSSLWICVLYIKCVLFFFVLWKIKTINNWTKLKVKWCFVFDGIAHCSTRWFNVRYPNVCEKGLVMSFNCLFTCVLFNFWFLLSYTLMGVFLLLFYLFFTKSKSKHDTERRNYEQIGVFSVAVSRSLLLVYIHCQTRVKSGICTNTFLRQQQQQYNRHDMIER